MVTVTTEPIDPTKAYDLIAKTTSGSVLLHYAVVKVRDKGGGVTCHIEYSQIGNTEDELQMIADEIAGSWTIEDTLLIRRIGRVAVGEIISLIAVSSPASEDALAACKFGIGRLKEMYTIAKKEVCA